MKKLLLASSALVGVAAFAAPAQAALKLDLGGYFLGYGVYADNDSNNAHALEFRRDNEIHVNGETTLDNGLTVGAHTELKIANTTLNGSANTTLSGTQSDGDPASDLTATTTFTGGSSQLVDETYLYASGGWGRVNFGEEDGAAYLLQVAVPSADPNVDGLRPYIQDFGAVSGALTYANDAFRQTDRLSYLTPKFNGFQAGVSYAPTYSVETIGGGVGPSQADNDAGDLENLWEAAARWDGEFSGVSLGLGAGYNHASQEVDTALNDDYAAWDVGANVGFGGFTLGGDYTNSNNGLAGSQDTRTWAAGLGYDNGPYHAGVSYLNAKTEVPAAADFKTTRYTAGGGYTFGPGLTFRGAVAWGKVESTAPDYDFTQVTVGTDVQF